MRDIWSVTSGWRCARALNRVFGIRASSESRIAWRVDVVGVPASVQMILVKLHELCIGFTYLRLPIHPRFHHARIHREFPGGLPLFP